MANRHARADRLAIAGLSGRETRERPAERQSAESDQTAAAGSIVAAPSLRSTPDELQISARILLHMSGQPRVESREVAPPSLTQAGMAEALGTTPMAVSNALRRLVNGGAVAVELAHVVHRWKRLKVYRLTPEGERLARHIRESMDTTSRSTAADGRTAQPVPR